MSEHASHSPSSSSNLDTVQHRTCPPLPLSPLLHFSRCRLTTLPRSRDSSDTKQHITSTGRHCSMSWTSPFPLLRRARFQWSKASGLYKNYRHHVLHCLHCSPDRAHQILAEERADKKNRLASAAEDESSQSAATSSSSRGREQPTHQPVCPLLFHSLCSPEVQQEPWEKKAGRWTKTRCSATRA